MTGSVIERETETPMLPPGMESGQDQRGIKHRLPRIDIVLGWFVSGTRGVAGMKLAGREVQDGSRPKLHSLSFFCFPFPARSDRVGGSISDVA